MKFASIILALTVLSAQPNAALASARAKSAPAIANTQPQKGSVNCRPRWPYVMVTCYA